MSCNWPIDLESRAEKAQMSHKRRCFVWPPRLTSPQNDTEALLPLENELPQSAFSWAEFCQRLRSTALHFGEPARPDSQSPRTASRRANASCKLPLSVANCPKFDQASGLQIQVSIRMEFVQVFLFQQQRAVPGNKTVMGRKKTLSSLHSSSTSA